MHTHPRGWRLTAALLAVLAVFALSACSGPDTADIEVEETDAPVASKPETTTVAPEKLITAEEVAKITGIEGVQVVDRDSKPGATGDVNFANEQGGVFLVVTMGTKQQFEQSLTGQNYGEDLKGVGDLAYTGPKESVSKTPNMVVFLSDKDSVAMTTFFTGPDETVLSIDQMKEIGNIIAERL